MLDSRSVFPVKFVALEYLPLVLYATLRLVVCEVASKRTHPAIIEAVYGALPPATSISTSPHALSGGFALIETSVVLPAVVHAELPATIVSAIQGHQRCGTFHKCAADAQSDTAPPELPALSVIASENAVP